MKQQSIDQIERGKILKPRRLVEIARALNVTPDYLALGIDPESSDNEDIPLVGYVQAGGEMIIKTHVDEYLGYVPMVPGATSRSLAVEVRGESMRPIARDGWLIFFEEDVSNLSDIRPNLPYVVWLTDGRVMLKYIRPGSKPDLFHLHSETPIRFTTGPSNASPGSRRLCRANRINNFSC